VTTTVECPPRRVRKSRWFVADPSKNFGTAIAEVLIEFESHALCFAVMSTNRSRDRIVTPLVRRSSTHDTQMRYPRTHAFPKRVFGSIEMQASNSWPSIYGL
jgi:hypothetical protein